MPIFTDNHNAHKIIFVSLAVQVLVPLPETIRSQRDRMVSAIEGYKDLKDQFRQSGGLSGVGQMADATLIFAKQKCSKSLCPSFDTSYCNERQFRQSIPLSVIGSTVDLNLIYEEAE